MPDRGCPDKVHYFLFAELLKADGVRGVGGVRAESTLRMGSPVKASLILMTFSGKNIEKSPATADGAWLTLKTFDPCNISPPSQTKRTCALP